MNLKEKFAQKMLDEKLSFLPVEETLELIKEYPDIKSDTDLGYVYSNEEIHDKNRNDLPVEKVMEHENFSGFEIGDSEHFDEFTSCVAPVFTYIDLIR